MPTKPTTSFASGNPDQAAPRGGTMLARAGAGQLPQAPHAGPLGAPVDVHVRPVAVAFAGEGKLMVGNEIPLDGSASHTDDDRDVLTYQWQPRWMPEASHPQIYDATSDVARFVADVPGHYTFTLIVRDAAGDSDTADLELEIAPGPRKPIAILGPATVTTHPGETLELTAARSIAVSPSDALTYRWSLARVSSQGVSVTPEPNTPFANFVAQARGEYEVQLVVTENNVDSDPATVVVIVN